MILTRAQLPKWFKMLRDLPERIVVHRAHGGWLWEYSFDASEEGLRLASMRWGTMEGTHCGGRHEGCANSWIPVEVMLAASTEAQRRTGRHPTKSPFWWVVKDGKWYWACGYVVTAQKDAARYTDRCEAEHAATGVPGRRVVRVRARDAA